MGKTTVWHQGMRLACELGHRVLVTRPLETDAKRSLTGLTDLLGDVFDEVGDTLPPPQHHALAIALLRAGSNSAGDGLGDHCRHSRPIARSGSRPPAAARTMTSIGSTHLAGETLRFALRRFDGAPIRFLATARSNTLAAPSAC